MTRFLFSFADVGREVESLKSLARPFLHQSAGVLLDDLRSQLEGIRSDRHRSSSWTIPLDRPLLTKPCEGGYQKGSRGKHNVCAAISATWEVRPSEDKPSRYFEIVGNASCRVLLLDVGGAETCEIGRFNVDIGNDDGPGAIFHAQISEQPEAAVFPSTLDVPRFPIPPLTPLGVVEYVLGELFQERWLKRVSERSNSQMVWNGLQRARLVNFLDWQLQILCGRRERRFSPLMDLKRSGAESELFLDRFVRVYAVSC